jgi:hypothetical protein
LTFEGDPDVVTGILKVEPDFSTGGARIWKRRFQTKILETGETDFSDVYDFLLTKSDELTQIAENKGSGFLGLQVTDLSKNLYIEPKTLELAGRLDLGVIVWFSTLPTKPVENVCVNTITISQPKFYFSKNDESVFFASLRNLSCVSSLRVKAGRSQDIILHLTKPILDDESLRTLLALLKRYQLPMRVLKSQLSTENRHWFKKKGTYWYQEVFCD